MSNKYLRGFKKFNESVEKKNHDLPLELEYKLRTIDDNSELTVDNFLEEFGIDGAISGFGWASILKQKEERFSEMSDEEFFNLYKNK